MRLDAVLLIFVFQDITAIAIETRHQFRGIYSGAFEGIQVPVELYIDIDFPYSSNPARDAHLQLTELQVHPQVCNCQL